MLLFTYEKYFIVIISSDFMHIYNYAIDTYQFRLICIVIDYITLHLL